MGPFKFSPKGFFEPGRPWKRSLSHDLASLVVKKRWPDRDGNDLLHELHDHKVDQHNLPKTKAKLLNTPKEKIVAASIGG